MSSSKLSMSLSMSVPNLPGMVPSKDTWLYRQHEGFKRTSQPRPRSAATISFDNLSRFQAGLLRLHDIDPSKDNNQEASGSLLRPSTAGYQRSDVRLSSMPPDLLPRTSHEVNRPSTAQPLGRNSLASKSSASILANFGLPRVEPIAPPRHQPHIPKFVENDKVVCRFYGYFYDDRVWASDNPLGVPTIENEMGRRLTILYYVDDNTISMAEPKIQNSGMTGGDFFRRGDLYKPNGEPISLLDLAPGNSINVLGREIFINDADPFTRDFFRREYNIILSPSLEAPQDIRDDLGALYATGLVSNFASLKSGYATSSPDFLAQQETYEKTRRFLKYDGKVLRFLCVEKIAVDPSVLLLPREEMTAPNNAKKFALSYFMTDRSIDIRLVKSKHSQPSAVVNLEESMLVMKQSKIAKNWRDVQKGSKPVFYEPNDFICGNVIDVYGRGFLLIYCDTYTRSMYDELGIEQFEIPLVIEAESKVVHPIPKLGDGFLPIGSEEDTLATVYGMPRVSRDVRKATKNQSRILRCKAKLISKNLIDAKRIFMITFYLEDDTVHIYEEIVRNSGIIGGTFLKRGKYLNALPPEGEITRYFVPQDIYLGNVISLNGNEMKILEMDNLSMKFCETYPDEFPMFDPFHICYRLTEHSVGSKLDLRSIWMKLDPNQSGLVEKAIILRVLEQAGIVGHVNEQEVLTLLRRIEADAPSPAVAKSHALHPTSLGGAQEPHVPLYFYHELCDIFSHAYHVKNHKRVDDEKVRMNVKVVDDLKTFSKLTRPRHTQWRRVLRKDTMTKNGLVTVNDLASIFRKNGLHLSDNLRRQLESKYSTSPSASQALIKEIQRKEWAAAKEANRLDIRSTARVDKSKKWRAPGIKSNVDINVFGEEDEPQLTIKQRREYLLSSDHYRNEDDDDAFERKTASVSIPVIDYNKLCNDIYICDWV